VDSNQFTTEIEAKPAENAVDRWRAEVYVTGAPRTITSHVWVKWKAAAAAATTTGPDTTPPAEGGCGCHAGREEESGLWALGLAALAISWWRRSTGR
jgi:MYXO-CTERM domain-containing protein